MPVASIRTIGKRRAEDGMAGDLSTPMVTYLPEGHTKLHGKAALSNDGKANLLSAK